MDDFQLATAKPPNGISLRKSIAHYSVVANEVKQSRSRPFKNTKVTFTLFGPKHLIIIYIDYRLIVGKYKSIAWELFLAKIVIFRQLSGQQVNIVCWKRLDALLQNYNYNAGLFSGEDLCRKPRC